MFQVEITNGNLLLGGINIFSPLSNSVVVGCLGWQASKLAAPKTELLKKKRLFILPFFCFGCKLMFFELIFRQNQQSILKKYHILTKPLKIFKISEDCICNDL
jgi:hypothetical protein